MKKIILLTAAIVFMLSSCTEPAPVQQVYEGDNRSAIIDNIMTRRAIRKFTAQQVNENQIDTIMKAAIYAPSTLNKQAWEIRVVQNPNIIEEINKRFLAYAQGKEFQGSAARYREPGFSISHHAPTIVVIATEKGSAHGKLDAGLALENILLSAHALGLGTCPLGTLVPILNRPEHADLLRLMNIPDDYEVTINVALGYPAESPDTPLRHTDRVKIIK